MKQISLIGAGRERASYVLLFFEIYEEFGQVCLIDHNKAGCDEYRKALNEAMISIWFYIIESGIKNDTWNQRQPKLKERKSGKPYDEI